MIQNLVWLGVHLTIATITVGAAGPPIGSDGFDTVTKFEGELKGVQRGVVIVRQADGTEVMVQPSEDVSAFQFVATANQSLLQPGARVRFSGTFDQAGRSTSPVTEVELFQVVSGKVPANTRQDYIPGVYRVVGAVGEGGKTSSRRGMELKVVGGVIALDNAGWLVVQAGKQRVRARLAPHCQFRVRYNNLSLAKPGDRVAVAGFFRPPDKSKVKAERVTVSTEQIIGKAGMRFAAPDRFQRDSLDAAVDDDADRVGQDDQDDQDDFTQRE